MRFPFHLQKPNSQLKLTLNGLLVASRHALANAEMEAAFVGECGLSEGLKVGSYKPL
jgi:hypothetical protein